MRIKQIQVKSNYILHIISEEGKIGLFDVSPYLVFEAFSHLKDNNAFKKIINGGYFIEWECGADLSADTIEANWKVQK